MTKGIDRAGGTLSERDGPHREPRSASAQTPAEQRSTVGIAPRSHRSALSRLERRWRMGGPGALSRPRGRPSFPRGLPLRDAENRCGGEAIGDCPLHTRIHTRDLPTPVRVHAGRAIANTHLPPTRPAGRGVREGRKARGTEAGILPGSDASVTRSVDQVRLPATMGRPSHSEGGVQDPDTMPRRSLLHWSGYHCRHHSMINVGCHGASTYPSVKHVSQ
jgi:hypothetical protein